LKRNKWTDDLLAERMATVDEKLEYLRSETESLRKDMNAGFSALRSEMHAGFAGLRSELRSEMNAGFAGVRAEMAADTAQVAALHRQVMALLGGFMVGLLGVLAVVVAKL